MPRSVLIVKLAAIGDVVMALPMVTAIRATEPDTRITWLCGETVAPLLRCVEGIDKLVVIDDAAVLAGSTAEQVREVMASWTHLGGRRFDAIYIAHPDARYRILAWSARARVRRSLGGSRGNRGLVPGRAHSNEYVRLVTNRDDYRAVEYPFPPLRAALPAHLDRRIRAFNPTGRPLIAITPGGARNVAREKPLRRWPLERYAEIALALDKEGYGVILTGNRTDGWVRTAFWQCSVLDLIGATDVPSLAAVLQRCAAVVAHDSGPLHIARLVGTPVVALLGPTPPAMFFRPDPRVSVLWPGGSLPCAPCYDGSEFAKCANNACMQMIGCNDVMNSLEWALHSTLTKLG